ncbi:hypothetical protein BC937DRAFT_89918 [Endogone sp. FLAS-F59071]|nr:hypothetical protein BC937DRAFT_89918 [Endogone sp. FLAS-F59071]|eukprot:RUS17491.1 hypothetical protein BC937DRAFT_89918 [Endogone sp. FLAS-F59071]
MDNAFETNPRELLLVLTRLAHAFENREGTAHSTYQRLLGRHKELSNCAAETPNRVPRRARQGTYIFNHKSNLHLLQLHDTVNPLPSVLPLLMDQFQHLLNSLPNSPSTARAAALEVFHAVLKSLRARLRDGEHGPSRKAAAHSLVVEILARDSAAWTLRVLAIEDMVGHCECLDPVHGIISGCGKNS